VVYDRTDNATVGDTEKVFHWFEKAYEEHNPWILHIKGNPEYDHLHSDPRFQDLLHGIGFPEDKKRKRTEMRIRRRLTEGD
jgi:hypothetical protein